MTQWDEVVSDDYATQFRCLLVSVDDAFRNHGDEAVLSDPTCSRIMQQCKRTIHYHLENSTTVKNCIAICVVLIDILGRLIPDSAFFQQEPRFGFSLATTTIRNCRAILKILQTDNANLSNRNTTEVEHHVALLLETCDTLRKQAGDLGVDLESPPTSEAGAPEESTGLLSHGWFREPPVPSRPKPRSPSTQDENQNLAQHATDLLQLLAHSARCGVWPTDENLCALCEPLKMTLQGEATETKLELLSHFFHYVAIKLAPLTSAQLEHVPYIFEAYTKIALNTAAEDTSLACERALRVLDDGIVDEVFQWERVLRELSSWFSDQWDGVDAEDVDDENPDADALCRHIASPLLQAIVQVSGCEMGKDVQKDAGKTAHACVTEFVAAVKNLRDSRSLRPIPPIAFEWVTDETFARLKDFVILEMYLRSVKLKVNLEWGWQRSFVAEMCEWLVEEVKHSIKHDEQTTLTRIDAASKHMADAVTSLMRETLPSSQFAEVSKRNLYLLGEAFDAAGLYGDRELASFSDKAIVSVWHRISSALGNEQSTISDYAHAPKDRVSGSQHDDNAMARRVSTTTEPRAGKDIVRSGEVHVESSEACDSHLPASHPNEFFSGDSIVRRISRSRTIPVLRRDRSSSRSPVQRRDRSTGGRSLSPVQRRDRSTGHAQSDAVAVGGKGYLCATTQNTNHITTLPQTPCVEGAPCETPSSSDQEIYSFEVIALSPSASAVSMQIWREGPATGGAADNREMSDGQSPAGRVQPASSVHGTVVPQASFFEAKALSPRTSGFPSKHLSETPTSAPRRESENHVQQRSDDIRGKQNPHRVGVSRADFTETHPLSTERFSSGSHSVGCNSETRSHPRFHDTSRADQLSYSGIRQSDALSAGAPMRGESSCRGRVASSGTLSETRPSNLRGQETILNRDDQDGNTLPSSSLTDSVQAQASSSSASSHDNIGQPHLGSQNSEIRVVNRDEDMEESAASSASLPQTDSVDAQASSQSISSGGSERSSRGVRANSFQAGIHADSQAVHPTQEEPEQGGTLASDYVQEGAQSSRSVSDSEIPLDSSSIAHSVAPLSSPSSHPCGGSSGRFAECSDGESVQPSMRASNYAQAKEQPLISASDSDVPQSQSGSFADHITPQSGPPRPPSDGSTGGFAASSGGNSSREAGIKNSDDEEAKYQPPILASDSHIPQADRGSFEDNIAPPSGPSGHPSGGASSCGSAVSSDGNSAPQPGMRTSEHLQDETQPLRSVSCCNISRAQSGVYEAGIAHLSGPSGHPSSGSSSCGSVVSSYEDSERQPGARNSADEETGHQPPIPGSNFDIPQVNCGSFDDNRTHTSGPSSPSDGPPPGGFALSSAEDPELQPVLRNSDQALTAAQPRLSTQAPNVPQAKSRSFKDQIAPPSGPSSCSSDGSPNCVEVHSDADAPQPNMRPRSSFSLDEQRSWRHSAATMNGELQQTTVAGSYSAEAPLIMRRRVSSVSDASAVEFSLDTKVASPSSPSRTETWPDGSIVRGLRTVASQTAPRDGHCAENATSVNLLSQSDATQEPVALGRVHPESVPMSDTENFPPYPESDVPHTRTPQMHVSSLPQPSTSPASVCRIPPTHSQEASRSAPPLRDPAAMHPQSTHHYRPTPGHVSQNVAPQSPQLGDPERADDSPRGRTLAHEARRWFGNIRPPMVGTSPNMLENAAQNESHAVPRTPLSPQAGFFRTIPVSKTTVAECVQLPPTPRGARSPVNPLPVAWVDEWVRSVTRGERRCAVQTWEYLRGKARITPAPLLAFASAVRQQHRSEHIERHLLALAADVCDSWAVTWEPRSDNDSGAERAFSMIVRAVVEQRACKISIIRQELLAKLWFTSPRNATCQRSTTVERAQEVETVRLEIMAASKRLKERKRNLAPSLLAQLKKERIPLNLSHLRSRIAALRDPWMRKHTAKIASEIRG